MDEIDGMGHMDIQPDGTIRIYPVRWKLWGLLLGAIAFVVSQVLVPMPLEELAELIRTRYGVEERPSRAA